MIKAILFDLDNTLIHNPGLRFVEAYLRVADEHFSRVWGYNRFPQAAMQIVKALQRPRVDPEQTNAGLSAAIIAESAGREVEKVLAELQRFYAAGYTTLRSLVQPVPGSSELVEAVKTAGYRVVIATNPLYPASAVRHRLAWGGLPDALQHYDFVSHAENMHFVKPGPAYYAEILACLGIVEPHEAIMVGDNWDNDIQPAAALGMHTYHIRSEKSDQPHVGAIQDFYEAVIGRNWLETLAPRQLTPEDG